MYQLFDDVVEDTGTGKKSSVRALQAWQYLIGKATNRQIVQYEELSHLMGYSDKGPATYDVKNNQMNISEGPNSKGN